MVMYGIYLTMLKLGSIMYMKHVSNICKAGVLMNFKKIYVCSLTLILILSVMPALSECSDCTGGKCFTSQFSLNCRYGCECHNRKSNNTQNITPTISLSPSSPSENYIDDIYSSDNNLANEIIRQVNRERRAVGLSELIIDPALSQAAYIRAAEITKTFSHTRPDGSSWRTASSSARGENIARGYNTPDKVMAAWLTSDGHRANIMNGNFGSIGVCVIEYNGVFYWVQLFGA